VNYTYSIYDLTLVVPFPCPMLIPAPDGAVPDVTVVEGPVPRSLPAPVMKERTWQAAPGLFLFRGGLRAGRFLVEGGGRIILERNPAAEDELLCALLISSVLAALLRQRGLLVLHANVAVTPRGAIAIAGESGSGKSTTQAALLTCGYRMLADDVTVLRLELDGTVTALPGIPKMNLCEDAAIKLGHDVANLPRNPLMGIKVLVPVAPGDITTVAVPLKKIYLINRHSGEGLIITPLVGVEKFAALQECIYGPQFPEEMPGLFPLVTAVAEQVDIIRLQRPSRGCSVNKVVEAILHG
jgi:hypothetical protein